MVWLVATHYIVRADIVQIEKGHVVGVKNVVVRCSIRYLCTIQMLLKAALTHFFHAFMVSSFSCDSLFCSCHRDIKLTGSQKVAMLSM